MTDILFQLGIAVFAAAVYALTGYGKSGEAFDYIKAGVTLVVGVAIGLVGWYLQVPVTSEFVLGQIALYAGAIALFENTVRAVLRRFFPGGPTT